MILSCALHISCWIAMMLAQSPDITPPASDDDFTPLLIPLMLIVIAICLVLIGVGMALAFAGVVCAAILVALGIVSSSTVVALLRRRVSTGVRLFHYQVCCILGAPGGITLLWAATALFHLQMRLRSVVLLGATAGLAAGLLVAGVFDWAARLAYRRLLSPERDGAAPAPSLPG